MATSPSALVAFVDAERSPPPIGGALASAGVEALADGADAVGASGAPSRGGEPCTSAGKGAGEGAQAPRIAAIVRQA
jgi:hypothetical protein